MPPDWKRIRAARPDITDWVIHWTRGLRLLQRILQCGYLKPSFAPRWRRTVVGEKNTIQGSYPAVCFTDQPLAAFIQSSKTLRSRYSPYGIALEKPNLFRYGGRPAIYGDTNLLAHLHDDDKYLWVRYNPIQSELFGNFPIDWTHEREWRARIKRYSSLDWGFTPCEGVPLLLPPSNIDGKFVISLPQILVRTLKDATALRQWLAEIPEYEGRNGFIKQLYAYYPDLKIIPLDVVAERLEAGDGRWGRLETFPWDEIPQGSGC